MQPPDPLAADAPASEYARRLTARQNEVARTASREGRLANARLGVFVVAGVLAWLVWGAGSLDAAWLLVPAAAYLALVIVHDGALKALARARRAEAWYQRAVDRLNGDWAGRGTSGERFADPHHPFALDLDLFGHGSLFELLCTARTRSGEETLAGWLLKPADAETARARQAAVAELRPRVELREELALAGDDVRGAVDPEALTAWASAPLRLTGPLPFAAAGLLSAAMIAALTAWIGYGASPLWAAGVAALQGTLFLVLRPRVQAAIAGVDRARRELGVLSTVLARLERERFDSPLLAELRADLGQDGDTASQRIASLSRRVGLLEWRHNQFFAPVAWVLLWTVQAAGALDRWRARSGPAVARWLSAVGELEALAALSGYAYEHPDDALPEIVDEGPCLEAAGLAHPLLPAERAVRNDVAMAGANAGAAGSPRAPAALLVSGSNMSGKSTLLRAVGANAVLALTGAPVRARSLRLSRLAPGATLRIQDSLQEGASRFYAEITRLEQVMQLAAGEVPVLFLLDEVLAGTNSHDRRIGARAIIQGLLDRGAVGLVTTHDLALAELDDPRVRNVHFEDRIEDGKVIFDYRLREGVVTRSNAIELMRAVGLPV